MTPLKLILALFAFVGLTASAFACEFNGRHYPPGTVIGDRVCQADGTWQRR